MDDVDIKSMENLSKTCYRSGIFPIFLGLAVIFQGVIFNDMRDVLVGLFMFAVGYSFVKISTKITNYLIDKLTR